MTHSAISCWILLSAATSMLVLTSAASYNKSDLFIPLVGYKVASWNADFGRDAYHQKDQVLHVYVDLSRSLHTVTPKFLSLCISMSVYMKPLRIKDFDYSSKRLQNLAAALSPTNVRFGGTYADFLHFDPKAKEADQKWTRMKQDAGDRFDSGFFEEPFDKDEANFTLPGSRWDNMTRFCDKVGWDIMWDFNLFFWKDGLWDPTDAKVFLKYSAARGVRMPSFQLGNEPNSFMYNFNFSIEPDVLVKDFKILKDLISEFPQYDASGIYGPECTNLDRHGSSRNYLRKFLEAGGCDAVTEIGLHHYYLNGRTATVNEFMDPEVLDTLKTQLDYSYNITWGTCHVRKPIRLTETSSAFGGGAEGLSNGYVAGFLWLDKLGLAAKYGVTHVFRQSFFGGRYALVDLKLEPYPDYFLTLLYKRLIEGPVFHVVTTGTSPLLRLYAHCARKGHFSYPDGALVVYYLNLASENLHLAMDQFQNTAMHLFMFTPGDELGMKSKKVKLNGRVLAMNGDELPAMEPLTRTGDIPVTPQSFGFIVIPSAEVPLCKVYHRSKDVERRDRNFG